MRSRAVSLAFACCASMRFGPPPSRACARRPSSRPNISFTIVPRSRLAGGAVARLQHSENYCRVHPFPWDARLRSRFFPCCNPASQRELANEEHGSLGRGGRDHGCCSSQLRQPTRGRGGGLHSPVQYQSYSCRQLGQEAQAVSSRAAVASGQQDAQRSRDTAVTAAAIVIFWPAAFLVGGNSGNTSELARLKGQMEAIEAASIQKRCGISFRRA